MEAASHADPLRGESGVQRGNPPRVVLVDDVPDVREIVREYLEAEGIEVTGEAGTGEEGVRMAIEGRPDVVIMDARLPDMDGIEASRRIKEHMPDVTVLMLTFYEDPALREEATAAGVRAFFTKAGTFTGLVDAIRDASPTGRVIGTAS